MKWRRIAFFALWSICLDLTPPTTGQTSISCSQCIQIPMSEWCYNPENLNTTLYNRCFKNNYPKQDWLAWCGLNYIYNPSNVVTTIRNETFTDADDDKQENIVQFMPQEMSLQLAAGRPQTLDVRFKFVKDYSLELYYLMDLSKSMEPDKQTIIRLADDLATELKQLTRYFRIGFGSFLDKVMLPYVNTHSEWLQYPCGKEEQCRVPYGFQNILSLTNDTEEFIESVKRANISTNWDDPEGGLDALIQTMVCSSIGWQKKPTTRHMIVYVSGSSFKYAGDGKLAGLTRENDMNCHLDGEGYYTYSSFQDYPSISQIQHMSSKNNMYIIFAVKSEVIPIYEAVSQIVIQSEASILSKDSSNIIDIITSYYKDISKTLKLTDNSYLHPNVKVTYSSKCGELQDWNDGSSRCEDVDINKEIQFRISFELTSCSASNESTSITISPEGLEDELIVEVIPNCSCTCEADENAVQNASECNFNGTFACGSCICNNGYSGDHCECKDDLHSLDVSKSPYCRASEDVSGKECSGHGICECGKCKCKVGVSGHSDWMYQGHYCECSNFDCPKSSGLLCSNHGICECSKCICKQGWAKEDCSCDLSQTNCLYKPNNKICSGHGTCLCNECSCDQVPEEEGERYFGRFCEDCKTCQGLCSTYENCVKCTTFETGPFAEDCGARCSHLQIKEEDRLDESTQKVCKYTGENGCLIRYSYDPLVENVVFVRIEADCSGRIALWVLIVIVAVAVILVGLIALGIWKFCVTMKDRKEYHRFLKETKNAKYTHEMNPIYKDPITRISNPLREMEKMD